MDEAHPSTSGKGARPGVRAIMKESTSDALRVVADSREVTGRPRQVVAAALLGTCVAFLLALLSGGQHLDGPLTVAAIAFVAAIPFLGADFIVASQDFKASSAELPVNVLKVSAFLIYDALGPVGVAVGLVAVLGHLGGAVVVSFFAALGFVLVTPLLVYAVIILWALILVRKAQSKAKAEGRILTDAELDDIVRNSQLVAVFRPSLAKPPIPAATPEPQRPETES